MRLYTVVIKTETGYDTKTIEAENLIHAMFYLEDEEAANVVSMSSYQISDELAPIKDEGPE